MHYFLQQFANGLHIAAIYALLGFGYALTNGVLHRTNLAHGALFGFAGQIMILFAVFGWQVLWLTLPATLAFGALSALLYGMLAAWILGTGIFPRLVRSSPNAIVVATLGISIVLMELARIAAETRDFWLPPLLAAPVVLVYVDGTGVTLTTLQVINGLAAVVALLIASALLARSRFGLHWRAVRDDPSAAALCGVDAARVFRGAVLGGGVAAAFAGILAALYYGNIGFGAGMVFGLKVLFVTAVGGYDSPPRAAIGAASFGIAESLWSGYFPIEWRDAWIFGLLTALLVLRAEAPGLGPRRFGS